MSGRPGDPRPPVARPAPPGRDAYARAGVDVAAGERAVDLLRASVAATRRPEVLGGLGGFGAAVAVPAGYREPVLVSATDGVGTKTAIAAALGRLDTIGIDLVAMCADDVVCAGAEPLAFLDYVAVGRLVPERIAALVAGVAEGCRIAGAALVGGETAEHPGLMDPDDFDLAGFSIGIVERDRLLDGTAARAGDLLVGLASSGLHANGYSLVRSVVAEHRLDLGAPFRAVAEPVLGSAAAAVEEGDRTLGELLLEPTRIHAPDLLAIRTALEAAGLELRGAAHVTGGGLPGNLPRALPPRLAARVDPGAWPLPPLMRLLGRLAGIDGPELRATFNAGLGMVLVVPAAAAGPTLELAAARGTRAWIVGEVVHAPADGRRYLEGGGGSVPAPGALP